ncbi:Leucine-rich repeat-containing protein sog2 [Fulvia fulva]|nr:Leucine-rich repeat-containing protein sog2 [Fulvia fulva]KAK4611027.1 Leucine-rich repeat-containing protein sog2 [Fulvia fulva]WPV22297.1 Leucine-rich repeat-containing protein sog2 [Fulvia fulva]
MASDNSSQSSRPPMTVLELIAFVKKELDTDEERQAKIALAGDGGSGVVPEKAHSGHTLDLSHKNIEALPVAVVALIKERVERLALSHNPRIQIPLEIAQCDKLRYLNLRWNKLRKFPDAVLSLSRLEILDISKNAIDGIPEGIRNMTNLKFLAVARNQIRRLPLALGDMNLVKLKFDENPIEFPPAEALKASVDRTANMIDSEKDKDMCQHVKKYMKVCAMQESLRSHSSQESMSESQETTPRPARRGVTGGRFPVRPSISSIDGFNPNTSSDSPPNAPPPIPQRSTERWHGHGVSSNDRYPSSMKRPHVAPLYTGGLEASRSRSETVASSTDSIRKTRGYGYVPGRKISQQEMRNQLSARANPTPALTPPHSRAPSVTSSYNNYLAVGSGNESSSGAVSPIDGSSMRAKLSRKLASLPESRNSRLPTITAIRAVKRVFYMLAHLYGPVADIAQQLGGNSSRKRTRLQLQVVKAHVQSTELDRMLNKASVTVEDNPEIDATLLANIIRAAIKSLREHGLVINELRRIHAQDLKQIDAIHVRCVITTAYMLIIEARNICLMLGFKIKPKAQRDTIRASQAWSSRTVTPTQPTSATSNRRRGNTILPSSSHVANVRGIAPPVPLHTGSRTNTMTSISAAATPRYNNYDHVQPQSAYPSRSNTIRSNMTDVETEETPERVYSKLKACCNLASQVLPTVRNDLLQRKILADNSGQMHNSRQYLGALKRCEAIGLLNEKLLSRLSNMRIVDAARHQKEFSHMIEGFGNEWANFGSEVANLASQRIDLGNIRHVLRPLQHAVKDANRATQHVTRTIKPPPHPGLPHQLNTALAQHAGQVPPMPATPLAVALGPAAQATVPPTPTTSFHSPEHYLQDPMRRPRLAERSATTLPLPSYPRI